MDFAIRDILVAVVVVAGFVIYRYFQHIEKQRRLEIIHQERLAAMEKGIPLPELPVDPPPTPDASSKPQSILIHGIVWLSLSLGGMVVLFLTLPEEAHVFWVSPLPLALLGLGLMLYHFLGQERER